MKPISILFCGDVVGRSGREAVLDYVPSLKKSHNIDVVVVSGDNAASGFGITSKICQEFFDCGVDVITGGDHIWDQKDMLSYLEKEPRALRPHNFPDKTPGRGWHIHTLHDGRSVGILHLLGQVFHKENLDCPFACAENTLKPYILGRNPHAVLVDMHAEATSEKNAMGVFLDGKVSGVVGSHTHVPTNDARILQGGTAYQTDTGMCGDYHNSIIGFDSAAPLNTFTKKLRKQRMTPSAGEGTLAATLIEVHTKTGLASTIRPILLGGAIGQQP